MVTNQLTIIWQSSFYGPRPGILNRWLGYHPSSIINGSSSNCVITSFTEFPSTMICWSYRSRKVISSFGWTRWMCSSFPFFMRKYNIGVFLMWKNVSPRTTKEGFIFFDTNTLKTVLKKVNEWSAGPYEVQIPASQQISRREFRRLIHRTLPYSTIDPGIIFYNNNPSQYNHRLSYFPMAEIDVIDERPIRWIQYFRGIDRGNTSSQRRKLSCLRPRPWESRQCKRRTERLLHQILPMSQLNPQPLPPGSALPWSPPYLASHESTTTAQ